MQIASFWLGLLLVAFAVIDLVLAKVFHTDLTGMQWSPAIIGGVGLILIRFGQSKPEEE